MKSRPERAALVVSLVAFLGGCQRGCLSTWLTEHGFGGDSPQKQGLLPHGPDVPCPDGLARCSGGNVRTSVSFMPASPCSPEGCKCPWVDAGSCARGCVLDGIELEMPPAVAATQLCAPADASFYRVLPPGSRIPAQTQHAPANADASDETDLGIACEVEKYRCQDGLVSACADGGQIPVAVCTEGCAEGERMLFDEITQEAALPILCAR